MKFNSYVLEALFNQLNERFFYTVRIYSWRARNFKAIDKNTLEFRVLDDNYVRIKYDMEADLYDIYFGHYRNKKWVENNIVTGVSVTSMHGVIEAQIMNRC